MKVKTELMKDLLSNARRVKPNNYLEISNFYELDFSNKGLKLTATDGANYLEVLTDAVTTEEPTTLIVKADQLGKLVDKTTKEELNLIAKDSYLEVKGNGVYKVDLFTDEDYPKISMNGETIIEVDTKTLQHAIECTAGCKSASTSDGVLFSYLLRNEKLITADSIKVACTDLPDFTDEVLISPAMAKMIPALDSVVTRIEIDRVEQKIKFIGDKVVITGALMEGANEYPDVIPVLEQSFPYSCMIDGESMVGAIGRLRIFLGLYDDNEIDLIFTKEALVISTKNGSQEVIGYKEGANTITEDILCTVKATLLLDIINSITEPIFTISMEQDLIKFESNDDIYLLATVEDE